MSPYKTPRAILGLTVVAVALVCAACGSSTHATNTSTVTSTTSAAVGPGGAGGWVDEPVTLRSGGMTVYATYRHSTDTTVKSPAVLLIAGSGPTDRNGNSALEAGPVDTLKTLADWLSADGVASLRYDKLGSGETGLGPYATRPDSIGVKVFEQESVAALKYLAAQPGVNPQRLGVFGHSEGALYALLLATGADGPAPKVHALGLIEPLSLRYLDLLETQVDGQVAAAEQAGSMTDTQGSGFEAIVANAVTSLRTTGKVPRGLPSSLASVFSPANALYLAQADRYDPRTLAAELPARFPVLLTCSNDDIQVTCAEVDNIAAGLAKAHAAADFVHLTGVDHVLKQDTSRGAADYTQPLPFSTQLEAALKVFVAADLN